MKKIKNLLTLFVTLLTLSLVPVFAGRVEISPEGNRVTKPGVISLYSNWVKNKGKKYDIGFFMKNEHSTGIIVLLSEMHCYHGGEEGILKHTFFNTGEKTMNFRMGELKEATLVCKLSQENQGEYRIVLSKVYENPSGDGKTMGKVLAKNVEWKVQIAE